MTNSTGPALRIVTSAEIAKALKDVRRQLRQIEAVAARLDHQGTYSAAETLQGMAFDLKKLVADGGKWSDFAGDHP